MPDPLIPLVVRFGAFGDMLLIIPMLKELARRYGHPCQLISMGPYIAPLFSRVPACDRWQLLTSRRAPYWFNRSQRELTAWLRDRPPGPVYVFEDDEKTAWLLKKGGIAPGWICAKRNLPRLPGENILAHALRLARETPPALRAAQEWVRVPAPEPDARPNLMGADHRDCAAWLERHRLGRHPLVLIQPGNRRAARGVYRKRRSNVKYWPEENWARVIDSVRQTLPDSQVVICGSVAERALADDIRRRCQNDAVTVATGDLPIPRLLALQARAHCMISVDTGPAHAAAAMGCPLVVLLAHPDRQLYEPSPTTAPVKIVRPDRNLADQRMAAIDPAAVIDAWRELIRTPAVMDRASPADRESAATTSNGAGLLRPTLPAEPKPRNFPLGERAG